MGTMKRAVVQKSLDGEIIAVFDTIQDAERNEMKFCI